MKLEELYKQEILGQTPTQDSLRIQKAHSLIGFREYNKAKHVLADVHGEQKAEAAYLLAIIATLEKDDDLAQQYLDSASSDAEFSVLNYTHNRKEIPSDKAYELQAELLKKGLKAYASLCSCYQTIDLPTPSVQNQLLQQLSEDVDDAGQSLNSDLERSARRAKDEKLENFIAQLEEKRVEEEKVNEKKRSKNKPSLASSAKVAMKKSDVSGGMKIICILLKIVRFFFAYLLPILYLFTAFVNAMNDENCGGANKAMIAAPIIIWMITIIFVKFKTLKHFDNQNERVTGAWWLFYLPTTCMLIFRTSLARQEAFTSAFACFATALLTCIFLAPQLIFMLPYSKQTRTRDDFYTAALCGIICFIFYPFLCMTFTDMTMETIGEGINAAIQTQK